MKERITFEEWYKFNVVDNEIIDENTDFCVKVFTSPAMSKSNMVMETLTPARIAFKFFAKIPVLSVFPKHDNYNTSMCVCLYLDPDDHEEEMANELFEDIMNKKED